MKSKADQNVVPGSMTLPVAAHKSFGKSTLPSQSMAAQSTQAREVTILSPW